MLARGIINIRVKVDAPKVLEWNKIILNVPPYENRMWSNTDEKSTLRIAIFFATIISSVAYFVRERNESKP